jgi:hypothetical protein
MGLCFLLRIESNSVSHLLLIPLILVKLRYWQERETNFLAIVAISVLDLDINGICEVALHRGFQNGSVDISPWEYCRQFSSAKVNSFLQNCRAAEQKEIIYE